MLLYPSNIRWWGSKWSIWQTFVFNKAVDSPTRTVFCTCGLPFTGTQGLGTHYDFAHWQAIGILTVTWLRRIGEVASAMKGCCWLNIFYNLKVFCFLMFSQKIGAYKHIFCWVDLGCAFSAMQLTIWRCLRNLLYNLNQIGTVLVRLLVGFMEIKNNDPNTEKIIPKSFRIRKCFWRNM